jgi:hypothetical protein
MAKERRKHELTLASGREVRMQSLNQWSVYAGLLEGLPTRQMNARQLEHIVAATREKDQHEPYLVVPVERPIEIGRPYPFGDPAALPSVACLARFHSFRPARDSSKDYSELTVIWFQEDYAFPLSEEAHLAITSIDWDARAEDHEF